jgi:hypothetical protein
LRDRPISEDDWTDLLAQMEKPARQAIRAVLKQEPEPETASPAPPFEHGCEVCGDFAYWGYRVRLREDKLGEWYCDQHRPDRKEPVK